MLVLTRRRGQSIKIGADIESIVVQMRGDHVGIAAPKSLPVRRKAVYLQIKQESQAGAGADVSAVGQTPDQIRRPQQGK